MLSKLAVFLNFHDQKYVEDNKIHAEKHSTFLICDGKIHNHSYYFRVQEEDYATLKSIDQV